MQGALICTLVLLIIPNIFLYALNKFARHIENEEASNDSYSSK